MKLLSKAIAICLLILISVPVYAGTITTSGATVQTIIDRVRVDLNETTAAFWADADLIQWIDEAITMITVKARVLESGTTEITLIDATYSYAISGTTPSWIDVEAVFHDSGVTTGSDSHKRIFTLKKEDIRNIGHTSEKGRPKVYCLWDNSLIIWPVPDSIWSGTTLIVYTVTLPSGVTTSTSLIETPAYFDPAILNYVKAKAHYKDKREVLGHYYMNLFNVMIQEGVLNIIRRNESNVK